MAKHKKNEFCRNNIHDFVGNKCVQCGDYDEYLFADDSWFRGYFLFESRPAKYRKK